MPAFEISVDIPHPVIDRDGLGLLHKIRSAESVKLKDSQLFTGELRPYQTVAAANMLALPKFVLGDDTGLGKTVVTLASICLLLETGKIDNVVVVTTVSSVAQWYEAVLEFTKIRNVLVLGDGKFGTQTYEDRIEALERCAETPVITITPYSTITPHSSDAFRKAKRRAKDAPEFAREAALRKHITERTMVVFDEIAAFANTASGRSRAGYRVASGAGRVYGLTATLFKNALPDIYGVFRVVCPQLLGGAEDFWQTYVVYREDPVTHRRNVLPRIKHAEALRSLLAPMYLSRRKADVAEQLPRIIPVVTKLQLGAEQLALYRKVMDSTFERRDGKLVARDPETKLIEPFVQYMYCQQLVNNPAVLGHLDVSVKETALIEKLGEGGYAWHKTVVFTGFAKWAKILAKKLESNSIPNVQIIGDMKAGPRNEAIKRFKRNPRVNTLITTPAGSEAINLQFADVLVFADLPLSFGIYYQTIGRLQRIGSVHESIIVDHLLAEDTVDERYYAMLKEKFEVAIAASGMAPGLFDSAGDVDIRRMARSDLLRLMGAVGSIAA